MKTVYTYSLNSIFYKMKHLKINCNIVLIISAFWLALLFLDKSFALPNVPLWLQLQWLVLCAIYVFACIYVHPYLCVVVICLFELNRKYYFAQSKHFRHFKCSPKWKYAFTFSDENAKKIAKISAFTEKGSIWRQSR